MILYYIIILKYKLYFLVYILPISMSSHFYEGKFDELSQLLGGAAEDDARLRALLGMNREEYDRKLKERLAMRKRGLLSLLY